MGSFKLGKMTLRSLFGKPETVMYPLEKRDIPAGHRGMVEIDMAKCILCGICVKRCPCSAIEVDKAARNVVHQPFRLHSVRHVRARMSEGRAFHEHGIPARCARENAPG